MARQTSTQPQNRPGVSWRGSMSLDQREAMIREAAYFRCEQRGFAPGHDLDDWLAAEAAIEGGSSEQQPVEAPERELQQGSVHGASEDDRMKRSIKQHPEKAIPQLEDIEPAEAPPRE